MLAAAGCGGQAPTSAKGHKKPAVHATAEKWTSVPVAEPPPPFSASDFFQLGNMTCESTTFCVLAGYVQPFSAAGSTGSDYSPLLWQWNGQNWSFVPISAGAAAALLGSACRSPSDCFAVGATGSSGLIEHFDGQTWSAATPAAGNAGVSLNGVACPGDSLCFAVGNREMSASAADALIEQWNGTKWTDAQAALPPKALWSLFGSIYCDSATNCWAMGQAYDAPTQSGYFFADHFDGTSWSLVPLANPQKFNLGAETGMAETACTQASSCITVGTALAYTGGQIGADFAGGVAETWNGTAWAPLSLPTPASGLGSGYGPTGVSCVSASDCWVSVAPTGPVQPTQYPMALLKWNGSALSAVTLPVHGALDAVACLPNGFCLGFGEVAGTKPGSVVMVGERLSPVKGSGLRQK